MFQADEWMISATITLAFIVKKHICIWTKIMSFMSIRYNNRRFFHLERLHIFQQEVLYVLLLLNFLSTLR